MARQVLDRDSIPAETMEKFYRSWEHTGGKNQAAIVEGNRIVSWHKNRKSAQSALSRHNNTFQVR